MLGAPSLAFTSRNTRALLQYQRARCKVKLGYAKRFDFTKGIVRLQELSRDRAQFQYFLAKDSPGIRTCA
eukprot:6850261-Pyramimonas_sp.AAC.1